IAQEMMRSSPLTGTAPAPAATEPAIAATPDVLTPEQVAQSLGVSVEDVMASIDAGDLKARKIGNAWRIAKVSLDEFLRG
ncbi:MAG: helix-turn-helix domain-containing protein, partial [Dokdonella sp.]